MNKELISTSTLKATALSLAFLVVVLFGYGTYMYTNTQSQLAAVGSLATITVDPASSTGGICAGNCSSTTLSHTLGSGTDKLLVVGLVQSANSNNGNNMPPDASTVTYTVGGGTPQSLNRYISRTSAPSDSKEEIWYLKNPTGSGTITVNTTPASGRKVVVGSVSFSGVDQTNPFRSNNTNGGNLDSHPTVTLNGTQTGDVVLDLVCHGDGLTRVTQVTGSTQTEKIRKNVDSSVQCNNLGMSTANGGGNITMAWDANVNDHWIDMAVALQPANNTPAPTATLSLATSSITQGQSTTLFWSSTNADTCTGINFTPSGTSGSQTVSPAGSTTYTISCTGTGGTASQSAMLTVYVTPPSGTFSLSVTRVGTGSGIISSTPSGVVCTPGIGNNNGLCLNNFAQNSTTTLSLTRLSIGSSFAGWSGCTQVTGSGLTSLCKVFMNGNKNVTITLNGGVQDTTAPIISSVSFSTPTQSGTIITWSTNEASDSQVEYGLTTSYGNSTTLNSSMLTTHSVTLGSLTANTTYHFRVKSKDAANNLGVSTDYMFTTASAPDTQPPTVPTGLTATAVSSSQINLSWTASTDNVGVVGYNIYRGGTAIGTSVTTSFQDTGLTANTTYIYTVSAFDAVPNTSGQSAPASATTQGGGGGGPVAFPLKYSSDSRYLVDSAGAAFPILGSTSWFLSALPSGLSSNNTTYQYYMDDRAAKGFNTLEFHVLNHDPRGRNEPYGGNGALPFSNRLNGQAWNGSLSYNNSNESPDFTSRNESFWTHVDGIVTYAKSKGIALAMFPAYTGFICTTDQGWGATEMRANGYTRMYNYGQFLANRYGNYGNIIWMAGGDCDSFNPSSDIGQAEKGLIDGIQSVIGNQNPQPLWSAEWQDGNAMDDQYYGSSGSILHLMNLNGTYNHSGQGGSQAAQARNAYANHLAPAFQLEQPYDQEGSDGNSWNTDSHQPARQYVWPSWMNQIGGYIMGNGYIWMFNTPGNCTSGVVHAESDWNCASHLSSATQQDLARLNNFIKSIAWYKLVPSGLGSNNGVNLISNPAAGGANCGNFTCPDDHISSASNPTIKDLLVVYVPKDYTGNNFTVNMSAASGTNRYRWFDPTNGAYSTATQSNGVFNIPGNNSGGYRDWILLMDNSGTQSDTQPPTVPTNLHTTSVLSTEIDLAWTASTDNVGVTGYKIYRGGTQIATSPTNSFANTGLTPSTQYVYTVSAYDAVPNNSAQSAPLAVTTQSGTAAPTATLSANPTSITTGGSSTLTWSSSNATSCTGTGGTFAGSKAISGSQSVSPTNTTTYGITCTGTGGTSSNASATVTVTGGTPPPAGSIVFVKSNGTGNGSSWANAAGWANLTFQRNKTYYLADGTYSGTSLNTTASSSDLITIKKATASDHGTTTDSTWVSTDGDGQAAFTNQIRLATPYWVFDGATGGGPGNWDNGFGFKITEIRDGTPVLLIGTEHSVGGADHVTVRHVELVGKGSPNGSAGTSYNNGVAVYGNSNFTLSYAYIHNTGSGPSFVNTSNTVFEYIHFGTWDSGAEHGEVASIWNFWGGTMGDITYRYNLFTHMASTGGIMWDNASNPNAHLYIYGNIVYKPAGDQWDSGNGVFGGWTGTNAPCTPGNPGCEEFHNAWVYNNTFVNVDQPSLTNVQHLTSGNIAKNNLWYNSQSPGFGVYSSHGYNHYVSTAIPSSDTSTSTATGLPFAADYASTLDFHLNSNTPPGDSNVAAQYRTDMFGNVGTTRGAIQFTGANRPSLPTLPEIPTTPPSNPSTPSTPTNTTTKDTSTSPSGGALTFTRNLSFGSSGSDVVALQNILISEGYLAQGLNIGIFGSKTRAALSSYQRAHGITPSAGYFGIKTRTYINSH